MLHNIEDLIADYLSDTLDPGAREDFERTMAASPELATRVALEQALIAALDASSPENQLRANLRQIANKQGSSESLRTNLGKAAGGKIWLWWVLLGALLILGVLVYWRIRGEEKPTSTLPQQQKIESPIASPAEDLPKATETEKSLPNYKQHPIAAAFKPIQQLEPYIGSRVRGGDFRIRVEEPQSGATLSSSAGQTAFRLAGKIEGNIPQRKTFNMVIFSNNQQHFEAMRPIERQVLEVNNQGDFLFQKTMTLTSGLYYYIIEEQESGEWGFVGKFLVK